MATGPGDGPTAASRDRLRAGHADREQVIEALKSAFVAGRLTRDELGTRAGRALTARTHADVAALTADIPPGPPAARPARPPGRTRRRPLARAAAGSGGCLVIAAAAIWAAFILDPDGAGLHPHQAWAKPLFFLAIAALVTAFGVLATGMAAAMEQRRSRRQLPPRPGPHGHALDTKPRGGPGHGSVPPGTGTGTGQARADLCAHKPPQRIPARPGRAPRHVRPARGAPVPRAT